MNVDELMTRVGLEQAARYFGVPLPELHRVGAETRMRCFLNCGKSCETGDRVLAIQEGHAAKQWKCHQYGCGKGGNLVSLCDLMKGGGEASGRPRGERFKEIARDLKAMAEGATQSSEPAAAATGKPPAPEEPKVNLPLAASPNERARTLVDLDAKFVSDIASMPPTASAYFRRRPFLSPEVCRLWRAGYLPRDSGGDSSGGTMRGKIVYSYQSADGKLLTWFGRDPDYEAKHGKWEISDRSDREPEKFHFVKGFHRGLELFGQERIRSAEAAEQLKGLGLLVVEGPNDVIRLSTLGVPAVGLCSNTITKEQAARVAELAYDVAGGIVTLFFDCDVEGEKGMKQALGTLCQYLPVRVAWTSKMYGGKFRGRQPESLKVEEWAEMESFLRRGQAVPIGITTDAKLVPELSEPDAWEFL